MRRGGRQFSGCCCCRCVVISRPQQHSDTFNHRARAMLLLSRPLHLNVVSRICFARSPLPSIPTEILISDSLQFSRVALFPNSVWLRHSSQEFPATIPAREIHSKKDSNINLEHSSLSLFPSAGTRTQCPPSKARPGNWSLRSLIIQADRQKTGQNRTM